MFAKGGEQNFSTEIVHIAKVIERWMRPFYELGGFERDSEGQFYQEELTPVRVSKWIAYKIDEILDKRVRRVIRENFIR